MDIIPALSALMSRTLGVESTVQGLNRLSGGANMESSSFRFAGAEYVLRRAPSAEFMEGRAFGHDVEAAMVRAACAAGVTAPEVVAELTEVDGIGTGYVMRKVEAEVNPAVILANPPPSLITDIGRELARIHAIGSSPSTCPSTELRMEGDRSKNGGGVTLPEQAPPSAVPAATSPSQVDGEELLKKLPTLDTAAAVEDLATRFQGYGGDRPIIALAIKWCRDNVPEPTTPVLVHGDFRMGNVMVDASGLAAVLDWELAHWGDAHEDLAYGCMTVWRFGHIDKPAFGVADLETYFAAYEAESGTTVDRSRFRFWLIYRTLWWALGCLQMGDIWRLGIDKSLERAVIGRRTSENELDLLLLLEEDAPETQALPIRLDPPPPARRQGEPSTVEMLEAVRDWVETDVKPGREGRSKFMAAVAMNALGMLIREAENPVAVHDKALSDDILLGRKTLASPGLLASLRKTALTKLSNDVPKYAALKLAQERWRV
jgi:aminoglycoside phosphotransferase (APT) family kinase protein